jgi:hypothetical protein
MHIPGGEALPVASGQATVSMPDEHGTRGIQLQESAEVFSFDSMHTYATSLATGRISSHSSCSAVHSGILIILLIDKTV